MHEKNNINGEYYFIKDDCHDHKATHTQTTPFCYFVTISSSFSATQFFYLVAIATYKRSLMSQNDISSVVTVKVSQQ